jgi:OFA family oxalate/formate antiporter-like MFS transporter
MSETTKTPLRGWIATFAGMAVNLCLGILYAWSVWKAQLVGDLLHNPKLEVQRLAGTAMPGVNSEWTYLTPAEGNWAYSICGVVFALTMILGGKIQDKFGPKLGVTLGGLSLAAGCIVAGLMHSFMGLVIGFGVLGGIGMGLGYAATTPAAVKWFGPERRGLIVGIVVAGYGAAAIYISPLGEWLIKNYGISGSFIGLGVLFSVVVVIAGQMIHVPPPGYVPPQAANQPVSSAATVAAAQWRAPEMLHTWQFYALVFLFFCTAQAGLLLIGSAKPLFMETTKTDSSWADKTWIIVSFLGLINALGRIGTGSYSDKLGRKNAYIFNALIAAVGAAAIPTVVANGQVALFFVLIGIAAWQYGGGLSLLPAFTADFFGAKNMGFNYGLIFLGWGFAFFVPQLAEFLPREAGEKYSKYALYLSSGLLVAGCVVCALLRRPVKTEQLT